MQANLRSTNPYNLIPICLPYVTGKELELAESDRVLVEPCVQTQLLGLPGQESQYQRASPPTWSTRISKHSAVLLIAYKFVLFVSTALSLNTYHDQVGADYGKHLRHSNRHSNRHINGHSMEHSSG